jgi:hypothetical protein
MVEPLNGTILWNNPLAFGRAPSTQTIPDRHILLQTFVYLQPALSMGKLMPVQYRQLRLPWFEKSFSGLFSSL